MCGMCGPDKDVYAELEELTLDGVVLTDEYADLIVNEK
jgi:hypothetical protein